MGNKKNWKQFLHAINDGVSLLSQKEWRIGEIRQIDGEWYQCIRSITCNYCGFNDNGCTADKHLTGDCSGRLDGASVIFRKLDKIGEPFELNGKLYQQIIPFNGLCECCSFYDAQARECKIRYTDIDCDGIFVEIKENKEDMEKKNKSRYDGRMDEECIPLCDALNSLPGVETTSSCCGHYKNDFMIFFNCNNSYSLAVIARAFSRRYSGTFLEWKIEVETHDNGRYDYFMHSVKPYPNELEMKTDVGQLVENVEFWKAEKYKEYFNYKGEEEQPDFGIPQEVIDKTVQEYLSGEEKPFCLEDAKTGKPVCTRDGRKARIICFDSTLENYPLVVLVGDYPYSYTAEGKFNKDSESSSDLVMLSEKKEGWVNVYDDTPIYDSKEEALNRRSNLRGYIDTVKVSWEE